MEISAAVRLFSFLAEEAKKLISVSNQVHALETELGYLQELLQDMDANRNLARQEVAQNFSREIRDLVYDIEDVIDEYLSAALTRKMRCFKTAFCFRSYPRVVQQLVKEIEVIRRKALKLGLSPTNSVCQKRSSSERSSILQNQAPHPPQFVEEDEFVVGIDEDIAQIVQRLTDPGDDVRVISIVGMSGLGKTALAHRIYNHANVSRQFQCKAFVCVPQQFIKSDLFCQVYTQITGDAGISLTELEVKQKLYYLLRNRTFLVVLDDVWDMGALDDIYPMLHNSKRSSKLILTTRTEPVKEALDDVRCIIHHPQLLTEDQSWALFSKIAIEGRVGIESNPEFHKLAKTMLRNCAGLPLAVKTFAGILRTKQELYQWKDVSATSDTWTIKGRLRSSGSFVHNILEMSYLDLPYYLKPCVLYMSIFPKGSKISAQRLVRLWIAEGFISNDLKRGKEEPEDVAMQYLEELVQRSLLQVTSRNFLGIIEHCRLHDLLYEFCISKARELHFLDIISSSNYPCLRRPRQPRRITISSREFLVEKNYGRLRTLVQYDGFNKLGVLNPNADTQYLGYIIKQLKVLRVLDISGIEYVALPKNIGKLINLRYLSINVTRISKVPKSVRNLINLLYIDFSSAGSLGMQIPASVFDKMPNLRRVVLPRLNRGSFIKLGLSGCKNLQSLCSSAGTWMKEDLPTLSVTLQNLEIYEIEEMEEIEAIYQCPGIIQDRICELKLDYRSSGLEFNLKNLLHCATLHGLELNGLQKFREGNIQFPLNLEKLSLGGSRIEEWPVLLGELPKLKYLYLSDGAYLGVQLSCAASAFPQLLELRFARLYNIQEWIMEEGAMARLRKMKIEHCLKLKRLPESIRHITTLKELVISSMPKDFCQRLGNGGEDSYIIEHIPSLRMG